MTSATWEAMIEDLLAKLAKLRPMFLGEPTPKADLLICLGRVDKATGREKPPTINIRTDF